jgi:hypothetical protein
MKTITIASQTFTKRAAKVKLPYIDQLAGFYLFGGNDALSTPNLAYGASQNLTKIGTPTYSSGYATIGASNGYDTGLLMDTPFTQFAVVNQPNLSSALAIFCRGTGNTDNFVDMLRWVSNASSQYQVDGWPNGVQQQTIGPALNPLNGSNFVFIAQTWGGTGTRHIVYVGQPNVFMSSGSSNSVTNSTTPTHTLRLGTGYNSGTSATQLAAAGLASSVLTIQQLNDIYIYLKSFLATRGVTML